jgi:hypothetical protein
MAPRAWRTLQTLFFGFLQGAPGSARWQSGAELQPSVVSPQI